MVMFGLAAVERQPERWVMQPNCAEVVDLEAFDAFLERSPQRSFWSTRKWTTLISAVSYTPMIHVGCWSGTRLLGTCSLAVRKRLYFSTARRPFATPFAGIHLEPDLTTEDALAVSGALGKYFVRRFSHVEMAHDPRFPRRYTQALGNWQISEKITFALQTEDKAALWRNFSPTFRNTVGKSRKLGVTFEASASTEAFCSLYLATFRRRGMEPGLCCKQLCKLIRELEALDHGRLYLALDADRRPCAGAVITWEGGTACYFLAASNDVGRQTGAPSGLLWYIFSVLPPAIQNCDLGGGNVPSIAAFKRHMRPDPVTYLCTSRYRSHFCKLQHRTYQRVVSTIARRRGPNA